MFWSFQAAEPLVCAVKVAFTTPTWRRFLLLISGLIVTAGRRSVSRSLRFIDPEGHWCSYHRLYSKARIRLWELALVLARQVVSQQPADRPLLVLADDTVDGKAGDCV